MLCPPGRVVTGVGKWLWHQSRGLSWCRRGAQANLLLPAQRSLFGKD